jgi:nucleotide-binding universal stress UspA family protein
MMMKAVSKIMVAVDFSEYSLPAIQYASDLAKDVSASLLLINVLNQKNIDMMNKVALKLPEFSVKNYFDEYLTERKERLEDFAKKIDVGNLDVEAYVCVGVPYKALLNEIEEKKPDLLIMGTKGRSNLVDMVVGSCALKMFRRCPIPLLSIREQQPEK